MAAPKKEHLLSEFPEEKKTWKLFADMLAAYSGTPSKSHLATKPSKETVYKGIVIPMFEYVKFADDLTTEASIKGWYKPYEPEFWQELSWRGLPVEIVFTINWDNSIVIYEVSDI